MQKSTVGLLLWGTLSFAEGTAKEAPKPKETPTEIDVQEGDQVRMPGKDGTAPSASGEIHTVVKGDTLWDLSSHYLGSPWYWPKVWSYNPEIANPHWIYPGNRVRFFGGGEEAPARVEAGGAAGNVGASPEEMAEGNAGENALASPELMEEDNRVRVSGRISYSPRAATQVSRTGFLTQDEIAETGKIIGSFSDPVMLSYPDTVYIRFKNDKKTHVGESYAIFHTERSISHPVLGGHLGYITKVDGIVKVLSEERGVVTAQIQKSFSDISIGFLVGPQGEKMTEAVSVRPNDKEMFGYIVATLEPNLLLLGEQHYVIVDKGSLDGVQIGNTFTVIRQGKGNYVRPHLKQDRDLPVESIGTCLAIDVKQKATTCVLTRSLREIDVGDAVYMKPEKGTKVSSR